MKQLDNSIVYRSSVFRFVEMLMNVPSIIISIQINYEEQFANMMYRSGKSGKRTTYNEITIHFT